MDKGDVDGVWRRLVVQVLGEHSMSQADPSHSNPFSSLCSMLRAGESGVGVQLESVISGLLATFDAWPFTVAHQSEQICPL